MKPTGLLATLKTCEACELRVKPEARCAKCGWSKALNNFLNRGDK